MTIRYAKKIDYEILKKYDNHIKKEELKNSIELKRVIVAYVDNNFVGWLRYNLFWDNIPFMNMLYLIEGQRGKGYGRKLVKYFEEEMKSKGYDSVMTSTLSNEEGQFFYRKLGYTDIGSLILPEEPLEIILLKKI